MDSKTIHPFPYFRNMRIAYSRYGKPDLALESEKLKNLFYKWGVGEYDKASFQIGPIAGDGMILVENVRSKSLVKLFDDGRIIDEKTGESIQIEKKVVQLLIAKVFGKNELKDKSSYRDPIFLSIANFLECNPGEWLDCELTLNKGIQVYYSTLQTAETPTTADGKTTKKLKKGNSQKNNITDGYLQFVAQAKDLAEKVRDLAVEHDHWHNSISPKEINNILSAYLPNLSSDSNQFDAKKAYLVAIKMLQEIFTTKTGKTFYWNLYEHPVLECKSIVEEMACRFSGHVTYKAIECNLAGIIKSCNFFISDDACIDSTLSQGGQIALFAIKIVATLAIAVIGGVAPMGNDSQGELPFIEYEFCHTFE